MISFRFLSRAGRMIAALGLALLAGACSGAEMLSAISTEDGVVRREGIAYGPGARQKMDIYQRGDSGPDAPVVVFVYGGSWDSGARGGYAFVGHALAARGFTAVIPDYRIHPEVIFPAFVEDVALAVAGIRETLSAGRPIFLLGHSAGAQIAALLTLDSQYLGQHGLHPRQAIAGFVGIAGPYDFLPLSSRKMERIFPEQLRDRSQPINFASGRTPPVMLLHGTADGTVSDRNSRGLAAALRVAGNEVDLKLYDGVGHIGIATAFAGPFRGQAPTLDDATAFIRRHSD